MRAEGSRRPAFFPPSRLSPDAWTRRHVGVVLLLAAHVPVLTAVAAARGAPASHVAWEMGLLVALGVLACVPAFGARVRSTLASFGLITCSALLVHFSGGYIEAHFHFFVVLGVVALYQDWLPYLLSVAYVAIHHGVVGTFSPTSVYNHPEAIADPWAWAGIHAFFIIGLSAANLVTWRANDRAYAELQAAQGAVRASESRRAALTDVALDSIVTIDGHGRVVDFNPAAERTFGYTRAEAVGAAMADLIIPPSLRDAHHAGFARYLRAGRATMLGRRLELTAMRKGGEEFPAEIAIAVLETQDGPLFVAYLRDLTEKRERDAELEAARQQLAQTQKMSALGTLVSGVAHEIRTPLTYINNNVALIETAVERAAARGDPASATLPKVRPLAEGAYEGVQRIDRIVSQLRRFTQAPVRVRAPVDLRAAVEDVVHLFRATHRGQVLVESDLATVPTVEADSAELQQVILNLLQNAAEAMEGDGRIHVALRADGDSAAIAVADEGPGIPPEVQAHMYDPFYTTKADGTGLGLAIVDRIVRDHRGALECRTGPGGTTFTVRLPFARVEARAPLA